MIEGYEQISSLRRSEYSDYIIKSPAERIGARIREIREAKRISQTDLGKAVGLNGDRMQKYEKGYRKPKPELLDKIASALDVSTFALIDPVIDDYFGAMFGFFEMEKLFGVQIKCENDKFVLSFKEDHASPIPGLLSAWERECRHIDEELAAASTEEERAAVLLAYQIWKWTFPRSVKTEKNSLKEFKKERIKEQIEELQRELFYLDVKDNK